MENYILLAIGIGATITCLLLMRAMGKEALDWDAMHRKSRREVNNQK